MKQLSTALVFQSTAYIQHERNKENVISHHITLGLVHESLFQPITPKIFPLQVSKRLEKLRAIGSRDASCPFLCIIVLFALILTGIPSPVFAYSGAGGECPDDNLPQLSSTGSSTELQVELNSIAMKRIEYRNNRNRERCWGPFCSGSAQDKNSTSAQLINSEIKSMINTSLACTGNTGSNLTLLDIAVASANIENIRALLSWGASPEAPIPVFGIGNATLFMRCIDISNVSIVRSKPFAPPVPLLEDRINAYQILLQQGVDVNFQNEYGLSPLHTCHDPIAVKLLLAKGANPELKAKATVTHGDGFTPLEDRISQLSASFPTDFNLLSKRKDNGAAWIRTLDILAQQKPNTISNKWVKFNLCKACQEKATGLDTNNICKMLSDITQISPQVFGGAVGNPEKYCWAMFIEGSR